MRTLPLFGVSLLALAACQRSDRTSTVQPTPPAPLQLGDPRPGLTSDELAAFDRGKLLFK
ncbi:MAG: hypothetical protein MUC36_09170 [Planctomycetes bacterium]|nr:hypothetical protein [Planctomycetota bacterium]